jgi:hypothetical protein
LAASIALKAVGSKSTTQLSVIKSSKSSLPYLTGMI